jgi:hypothetical protein
MELKTVGVTFDKNDSAASGTMAAQGIVFGTSANLTADSFVKKGWSFFGWSTSATGNVSFDNEASYTMTSGGRCYFL